MAYNRRTLSMITVLLCIISVTIPFCFCNLPHSEMKMLHVNNSFDRMVKIVENFSPFLISIDKLSRGGEPSKQLGIQIEETLRNIIRRNPKTISKQCASDIMYYAKSVQNSNYAIGDMQWYRQMMDSYGSQSVNTNAGNTMWTGDYKQCVLIDVHKNCNGKCHEKDPDFEGKYCFANVNLPFQIQLVIGTCIPSTCKGTEINRLLGQSFYDFNVTLDDETCETKTESVDKWDTTSITILIIFAVLCIVVAIATIIDSISTRQNNKYSYEEQGPLIAIISAFSAYRNTTKTFNTNNSDENTLECINGLRAISMFWIIAAHNVEQMYSMNLWKNPEQTYYLSEMYWFQAFVNAEFAVDTFIFITGFLLLYTLLKHVTQTKGKFNICQFYFRRFIRITPAYALVLAFYCGLYNNLGSGPYWSNQNNDYNYKKCRKHWWRNLLFINVYFVDKEACMTQSWYLCLDIFYHIMSPLLFIPLYRKPKQGLFIWGFCFVASICIPAYTIYYNNLSSYVTFPTGVRDEEGKGFFYLIYTKPWTRMHVVLLGMLLGFFYYHRLKNLQMNKVFVSFMWLIVGSVMFLIIYGTYPYCIGERTMSREMSTLYGTFARPLWAMTIGWIVVACTTGYGGVINTILSWKALMPISKLSYSYYLVHYMVIQHLTESRKTNQTIDLNFMCYRVVTVFVFSSLFAFLLNILTEAPIIELEKILRNKRTDKRINKQSFQKIPLK